MTLGWPTVHEKTSHGPPMERWSLRPAMGYVGLTPIDRTLHTISLQNALEMVVLTPQGAGGTCGQLPGTGTDAYAHRIAPLYVSLLPRNRGSWEGLCTHSILMEYEYCEPQSTQLMSTLPGRLL